VWLEEIENVPTKIRASQFSLPDGSIVAYPYDLAFDWSGKAVIPADIDIFTIDVSTVQRFPIGTKLSRMDNVYRYSEYGNTTVAASLLTTEVPDPAHDNLDPTGTGSAYGTSGVTAGETLISTADTITLVKDEYAGGSMVTEADTGAGYRYRILRNDAEGSNASFEIQDGLAVAINSTTDLKLVKSLYKEILPAPTTQASCYVGFGQAIGADGSFGWVCTRGPTAALEEASTDPIVIGDMVTRSDETEGAIEGYDVDDTVNRTIVGRCMDVAADTEFALIFALLE
jgi:hypothetical protein